MKSKIWYVLAVAIATLSTSASAATTFVTLTGSTNGANGDRGIYTMDLSTGALSVLRIDTSAELFDLAVDWRPASTRLWAYNDTSIAVREFSPATGIGISSVSSLDPNAAMAIAYDISSNTMYGLSGAGRLRSVDLSGPLLAWSDFPTPDFAAVGGGLGSDPAGNFYATSSTGDLLRFNKTTGNNTVVGPTGVGPMSDIAYNPDTGLIYGTTGSPDNGLYQISTANGATKLITHFTVPSGYRVSGLAFTTVPEPSAVLLLLAVTFQAYLVRLRAR